MSSEGEILYERFCNDREEIFPHKQFCAEITFVISGNGTISTNGVCTSVSKNDCYLSFQGDVHGVCSEKETALRYFFIGFNPADEVSRALLEDIQTIMRQSGRSSLSLPELAPLFHSQLSGLQNRKKYTAQTIGVLLHRMLILIYDSLTQTDTEVQDYQVDEKSMLAYKIMAYIDENVFSIQHLNEMESVFYFKYRYLEKCFIAITGVTISGYYKEVRMRHAAKMLKSNLSVTEISEKLNFSSIYSFSRAFSDFHGCSPTEYRKLHHDEG